MMIRRRKRGNKQRWQRGAQTAEEIWTNKRERWAETMTGGKKEVIQKKDSEKAAVMMQQGCEALYAVYSVCVPDWAWLSSWWYLQQCAAGHCRRDGQQHKPIILHYIFKTAKMKTNVFDSRMKWLYMTGPVTGESEPVTLALSTNWLQQRWFRWVK